jgi:hypothetical protein
MEAIQKSRAAQMDQSNALISMMERWRALSRYDDDIRAAVDQLAPFGEHWVIELARAYFALNESREYLPNIVARLLEEARLQKALECEQAEMQRWEPYRQTADGELCSEDCLDVLRRAEASGFTLSIERSGTFIVTKPGLGTSYLRSNYDIQQFARWRELKE